MKKVLFAISALIALACAGQYAMTAGAAAYPPALGGTGTGVPPTSGQVLIGNGAGTYTPALITPGTDIIITNASGSVTIAVRNSDFLPSSTIYVASVNGQTGAVTITSSTLGVATNTLSLFNGNGFTTTTIQSVLNALSATGLASYNSSTGQFSVSSSSLNLKSASQYNYSDFLPSSTVYVATVNGQSGAVTIGVPATTTINGVQATVFKIIGDGTTVTSTVNGTTTIFSIINTGNWQGPWQGVNSTTFYLASNPLGFVTSSIINGLLSTSTASNTYYLLTNPAGYLTSASSGLLYYPLGSNPAGYVTSTGGGTTTINSFSGSVFKLLGSGNVTTTNSNGTTTFSLTGVIPAGNGGIGTTTALGSNAFTSTAIPTIYVSSVASSGCISLSATSGAVTIGSNCLTYYNVTSANGLLSVVTTTNSAALTVSTSSLNLGVLSTYSTSSLFSLFSAAGTGLTYNSSTGQYTWTNPGYVTSTGITSYSRAATKTVCASNAIDTTNCDYKATGTDDGVIINTAIQVLASSTPAGGLVQLSEGTFNVSTTVIDTVNGIEINGMGQLATVININAANKTYGLHIGHGQAVSGNIISQISNMTIKANNTSTIPLWMDGMGQGAMVYNIDTQGGKYGAVIEDVDRSNVENLRASSAWIAGIDFRVGIQNTFGTLYANNIEAGPSYNNGIGINFDVDADQSSPNPLDVITIVNSHLQENNGLTGGICMNFAVGVRDLTVEGSGFEDCDTQVETNGNEVDGTFGPSNSFINSYRNSANIIDAEGYANITFITDEFQQSTNAFNGGTGYPNLAFLGTSKNNGNITNLFTGGFSSIQGTDVNFTGTNKITLGFSSSSQLANLYSQNIYENGSLVATSTGISSYARAATKTVCASNALDITNCDYKATGSNDDVKIQSALNAVSSTGGTVLLSEGTFNIATSVIMNASNVMLRGNGWDTNVSAANSLNGPVITTTNGSLLSGITIENMQVNGNRTNNTSTMDCMDMRAVDQSTFTNLWVTQCPHTNIAFTGTGGGTYGYNNTISNDLFDGNGQNGLTFSQNDENLITGNLFKTLTGGYDILDGAGLQIMEQNTFEGVSATSGTAIYEQNNSNDLMENNTFDGPPGIAIQVDGSSTVITGNNFYNCSNVLNVACVLIKAGTQNVFANNIVHAGGNYTYALDEQVGPGVLMLGNSLAAGTSGIFAGVPSSNDQDFFNIASGTPGGGAYWGQVNGSTLGFNVPTGSNYNLYTNNSPTFVSFLLYGTSTGALKPLTLGTNLSISGGALNATGGGSGIASTTPWTLQNPVVASGTGIATISTSSLLALLGAVTSTSASAGMATGTIYTNAVFNGTNTIASGTQLNVPTNLSGCGTGDFGSCVNTLYNSVSSTASSVIIMVPNINLLAASWTTPINFNINQLIPNLVCPGGAKLHYGGVGAAVTFNFNVSGAHDTSQDYGCTYLGSSTVISAAQVNTATTTGIVFGGTTGTNAANGIDFHDNNVNGFGTDLLVATNSYMMTITHNSITGGNGGQVGKGSLLQVNTASNSGERLVVDGNNLTDPGNSSSSNAIYIADQALASGFFTNNSLDDATIFMGISNGNVEIHGNHFENAAYNTYHMKYFIIASSSGATDLNVEDNMFALDNTGATGQLTAGIEHAVNLVFNNNLVDNYGGASAITNFIDHTINAGQAVESVCSNWSQNTAVSNWMNLSGVPYPGCVYEAYKNYPISMTIGGGTIGTFTNGNQTVGTFDMAGNWSFLNSVNSSGTLTVVGTSTFATVSSTQICLTGTCRTTWPAYNGSSTITTTSTPTLGSQYASSSVTFNIYDATTTAPYRWAEWIPSKAITVSAVYCNEYAAATTTIELYQASAIATTTVGTDLVASIGCGAATSTTSITTSTVSAGIPIIANVSTTAGTPSWKNFTVYYKTN